MITTWTRHLKDEQEIKNFEKQVRNSRNVLDRLSTILTENLNQLESVETSLSEYDTSSWSHKQAHRNGQRSVLKNILKIISLDQKEHK